MGFALEGVTGVDGSLKLRCLVVHVIQQVVQGGAVIANWLELPPQKHQPSILPSTLPSILPSTLPRILPSILPRHQLPMPLYAKQSACAQDIWMFHLVVRQPRVLQSYIRMQMHVLPR